MKPPIQIEPQTVDIDGLRINDSLKWSLILIAFFLGPIFYLLSKEDNQRITLIIPKDSMIAIDNDEFHPYPNSNMKNESVIRNFMISLKEGKHIISIKSPGTSIYNHEFFVRKSKHIQVFTIIDGKIVAVKTSDSTDKS